MNLEDAIDVSNGIRDLISPYCLKCVTAGSIRRREAYPNDIDIVLIPSAERPPLVFGQKEPPHPNMVERKLWQYEQMRVITLLAGGPKLKRYEMDISKWGIPSAIPLMVKMQITIATPENWAYWVLVRTGPASFSRKIVTPTAEGGFIPNALHYQDFSLWHNDERLSTPDESDWFKACNMPYVEPIDRATWRKS